LFEVTDLLVDNSAAHIKHHFIALYHRTVSLPACAVYATANPSVCPSVRPSVHLFVSLSFTFEGLQPYTVSKQLNISHHLIATSSYLNERTNANVIF